MFFLRLKVVKMLNKIPNRYENWKYMNSKLKKKL
jgi:hypothetical protein